MKRIQENEEKAVVEPSVAELQKEIRSLKRKLALAETNITRARLINAAQDRSEDLINASLKKEVQFFKLVLENATNILLLFDSDGRFAYASNTFLINTEIANFGLINGRQYVDVLRPLVSRENLEQFNAAVEHAVSQKSTVTLEEQIDFNSKGTSRTFSILVTSMTDEAGASTGIMALFNDITEINNALETANRANLAKSDFLANMSHEIRTPLNAIIGMTAIARSSGDIEKAYYCLDKINDSSTHLLGVINDILDMSKIETNHFELSFSEFVFEKMLLRIVDVMRFKIEEKNIYFTMHCDPQIPYIIASDEQRLAQVVMNLLSNAVKFTPENGSVALRAQVERVQGEQYTLRISVRDSGIGIADEQKPRLFKVFSQADSSISRKFGGTGLGLAISKKIINMLGGDVWFENNEEQGTTFIFNMQTRACKLEPALKLHMGDVRILAVDDMPDVRMSFSHYAKKLGVDCTVAGSAEEALQILEEQSFHIVFVDWKMPGMDGLSFVQYLHEMQESGMVVIMISAADWTGIEKEAKSAGVKEFISKPILLPVIEAVLDKYCDTAGSEQADERNDFSSKTVLLVDDIEINREIIISLLEETGIHILCAENGKDALERFIENKEQIDLIFMDIQMPEMDGYEATRRIRSLEANGTKQIPIVAMTANVFKEDIERCLESGMNDHVGKPVDIDEILAKIKLWTGIM